MIVSDNSHLLYGGIFMQSIDVLLNLQTSLRPASSISRSSTLPYVGELKLQLLRYRKSVYGPHQLEIFKAHGQTDDATGFRPKARIRAISFRGAAVPTMSRPRRRRNNGKRPDYA